MDVLTEQLQTLKVNTASVSNPTGAARDALRSNTWCGKCHQPGHLATECTRKPTIPGAFCSYCLRKNHTEDICSLKEMHDRRKRDEEARFNLLESKMTNQDIGPKPREFGSNFGPRRFPSQSYRGRQSGGGQRSEVECYRCGEKGHISPNCPNPRRSMDYKPLCSRCKGEGHTAKDCPSPAPLKANATDSQ